jgi:hypothetical protein
MNFYQKKFSRYVEFENEFEKHKDETFLVTYVRSSMKISIHDPTAAKFVYEKLLIKCKHSLKCETNQDGSRPNQQSFFTDCKYTATLKYDRSQNCLAFKGSLLNIDHNHHVSKEAYSSYTSVKTAKLKKEPVKKLLTTLITTNASVYHQASALVACKNPIGIPKGSQKQTATSFLPSKLKRRAKNQLTNLRIKRTTITHQTITTTTTTTSTTSNDYDGDDTLERINELDEDEV